MGWRVTALDGEGVALLWARRDWGSQIQSPGLFSSLLSLKGGAEELLEMWIEKQKLFFSLLPLEERCFFGDFSAPGRVLLLNTKIELLVLGFITCKQCFENKIGELK